MTTLKPSDLRISPLFYGLSQEELSTVLSVSEVANFPAKSLVIKQDDPSDYFYVILQGSVRVFRSHSDGNPVEITKLRTGSFFGEMAVLDGSPRSVSIETLTDSCLLKISRENFLLEIEKVPRIALKLLRGMSVRVRKTDEKFIKELQEKNVVLQNLIHELKKIDEMKTKFFHLTSHELRTPLGIILMGLSLLEKDDAVSSAENRKTILEPLQRQILRLSDSITSILKASDTAEPLAEEPKRKVKLNQLIQRSVQELHHFFRIRKLKLSLVLDSKIHEIPLYSTKFSQVILNLLMNAIRFTPDGGSIQIKTAKRKGVVLLSVSDSGVGIEKKHIEDIFKPFYVIEDTMKHSSGTYQFLSGGLGLGLTIVKKFTELHGGNIKVKSLKGKGTTFTVKIPIK